MSRAPGRVVLFTGPTGAGKTSCASTWAAVRDRHTAWFDHDEARFILRSGYVSRSAAAADESLRPEADRQWLLAAAVCESMAQTYIADGVDFSLSAFRPPGEWKGCWSRLDALDPLIVVLLPPMDVALERDDTRTGRAHTGRASIERAYSYNWDRWRNDPRAHVLDNSTMSVEDVAGQVEQLIRG
jgi:chloramphenicol 3-O-phosphotransferase